MVHSIMYSYYALSILGYKIWWKKYVTIAQIGQFAVILLRGIFSWTLGPQQGLPDFLKAIEIAYTAILLVMFGNFYHKAYLAKKSQLTKKAN